MSYHFIGDLDTYILPTELESEKQIAPVCADRVDASR